MEMRPEIALFIHMNLWQSTQEMARESTQEESDPLFDKVSFVFGLSDCVKNYHLPSHQSPFYPFGPPHNYCYFVTKTDLSYSSPANGQYSGLCANLSIFSNLGTLT